MIRGERDVDTFHKTNKVMYEVMLKQLKKRWDIYISVLETQIIEDKLRFILNSITFRYSRSADFLSLIPDRLSEINLRLKSTIKMLADDYRGDDAFERAKEGEDDKGFYRDVYNDPNRSRDLREHLGCVLHALAKDVQPEQQPERKLRHHLESTRFSANVADTLVKSKPYVIHKHAAISGVSVAKKPRYQLIASLLYLIKFWLKKVDPKPHLFQGKSSAKDQELNTKEAEEEYTAFIESIENGLIDGYGQDELNRVIDIRALKQGNISEFDAILDHKML